MIEDMTVRNLSPATQRSYLNAVSKFSRYFGRSPDHLGLEDVHAFQVHLVATGISWPALNQIVCALRFFYGVTLSHSTIPERIAYPRKLPVVLGADEVVQFLEAIPGLKSRTALTTVYATGLRVSEVVSLQGRVVDVSRDGFLTTLDVSCWTFIRMAHLAEPLMREGGTLFTMTYYGSQMVVKNYNIMGVAKGALESAVRYISAELGPKGIRVHAISPGPLTSRAASGIPEFDALLNKAKAQAPARSLVSIDDVGVATAFLAHDAARLITGETLYVDGGYHIID